MRWPGTPPAWLLPWAIWRFRNMVGPRPTGVPKEVPKWAWEFLKWCEWRRKNPRPERPSGLPDRIPQWGWNELKMLNLAVPLKPPAPPPPPPPPPPPAGRPDSWHMPFPILYTAWGRKMDWRTESEMAAIADRIADSMRGGTVALQIGQADRRFADVLRSRGNPVAAWGMAGANDQAEIDALAAEGYILQIEGQHEYEPAMDNLRAGIGTGLSLATVTTFAGIDTRPQMDAMLAEGCTQVQPEVYAQTGWPRGDVGIMMNQATIYGASHAHPVVGLYWDVDLATYDLTSWGRQVGFWLAETMRPVDWAAVKAL